MKDFRFDPPLVLSDNTEIRTLDQAKDLLHRHTGSSRPVLHDSVLHRLERAVTEFEQRNAADAFRGWLKAEGLADLP
jgi:hypothetical protein